MSDDVDAVDAAVVAALTGQVRMLDEKVDTLAVDVAGVGELTTAVETLAGQVDALGKSVAGLVDDPPAALSDWLALDAATAVKRWALLGRWVADVFVPGYGITRAQLPDCWPMHTPAMVQIAWLHAVYVAAYDARANPVLAAEVSTRWQREAITELARVILPHRGCKPAPRGPGTHLGLLPDGREQTAEEVQLQKSQEIGAALAEKKRQQQLADVQRRREATFGGSAVQPRPAPQPEKLEAGSDQLARPEFWSGWFQRARTEDIERRRQREAADHDTH